MSGFLSVLVFIWPGFAMCETSNGTRKTEDAGY